MNPLRILSWTLVLCTLFVVISCMPPLTDGEGQPTTEQAVMTETNSLLQSWKDQIAILEAKPSLSAKEQGKLAELKANLVEIESYVAQATTPEGGIDVGGAVTGGAMLLPFPWNIIGAVGAGGIVEWWRNRKTRTSFQRLVEGINRVKDKDDQLANAFDANSEALRTAMGDKAAREVDRVRKGGKVW